MDLVAKYQHETHDHLDTRGLHPNACRPRHGRDDD